MASTYVKKEMFSESEPDLVIVHANELVTMNTTFGAPRIGKEMSELAIIHDGGIAIKDDRIIFVGIFFRKNTKKNRCIKQISHSRICRSPHTPNL
ncbi:MAG: hypothetical protein ACXAEX_13930 [Promethearchaeota archaeon]